MTLKQLIDAALKAAPDGDPLDIAKRIRRKVPESDILNLIAREVEWTQRGRARSLEHAAMIAFRKRFSETPFPTTMIDPGFRALFQSLFHLGDGTIVSWGEATIEQHQQRIAFLTKQRDGIDLTIAQHEAAIHVIEEAGVSCLADIEEEAA